MDPVRKGRPTRLDVRTRRLFQPAGLESRETFVLCPRRNGEVSTEVCASCARLIAREPGFVICEPDGVASDATPHLMLRPGFDDARVADVMNREVLCISETASVDDLIELLIEHGITGVPVLNDAGQPVGMVSKTDLIWEEYERKTDLDREPGHVTVGDIMSRSTLSIGLSGSVLDAAAKMADEGLHRLPVVDPAGRVVGMISALDVLRVLSSHASPKGLGAPDASLTK